MVVSTITSQQEGPRVQIPGGAGLSVCMFSPRGCSSFLQKNLHHRPVIQPVFCFF